MIVIYVAATLVAILVAMAIIGSLLPRDHTATRSATFACSPDEVWRVMLEVDAATRARDKIAYVIDDERPPTFRKSRIADDTLPYGGTWTFEITPDGAGSRLTITEDGFVKNPIFRFLSKTVFSTTKTMERFLADVGAHLH